MFQELKMIFQTHAHVKSYETSDMYFAYKMEENSSASEACAQNVWVLQSLESSGS